MDLVQLLPHDVNDSGRGDSNPVITSTGGSGENVVKLPLPAARLIFELRNLSLPCDCKPKTSLQNSISTSPHTIAVVVASAGMIRPAVTFTACRADGLIS